MWPMIINLYYAWNKIHCLEQTAYSSSQGPSYITLPSSQATPAAPASPYPHLKHILVSLYLLSPVSRMIFL